MKKKTNLKGYVHAFQLTVLTTYVFHLVIGLNRYNTQ